MNGCRVRFWGFAAVVALAGAGAAVAQPVTASAPQGATAAAFAAAEGRAGYPRFAAVPTYPKDVRSVAAWKAAVSAIKGEGASVVAQAAAEPWTLYNTEAWADDERAIAAPPPPIPEGGDTAAFVEAMRQRATPPPPLRHAAGAQPASHP